jgi:D-methionine transport system substrate-binding protein
MRGTVVVLLALLAACIRGPHGEKALRVGVTPVPAGELIAYLAPKLIKQGVEIKIVSFSDYIQPNLALVAGELDANLYQNVPFMNQFNRDHGSKLVSVTRAYLPPMAIYPGRSKSLAALPDAAIVALPNDPTNLGRGLLLLQSAGLIALNSASSATLTTRDIAANPKHLQLRELEAAQLPRSLQDVDAAVINANFALDAGLSPTRNTLFRENTDSAYANILAVNNGSENDPRVIALARAITSEDSRHFLKQRYKGAVSPSF